MGLQKLMITLAIAFPSLASAMPIKSQMLKPRAFYQEADNNLLEALDLKSKTLTFTKQEFDQCGSNLVRRAKTLTFSCTLPIPSKARITKLQSLVTPKSREIAFGGTKRAVLTHVTDDAKSITFTTAFDATGVDFEVSKFNDDFFAVYSKVAQLIISDAIKSNPVRIEVLESR
ncbi:MAG TPA: hypothetical protein PKC28_09400 [Bdellovibrionales bacterium]|nr:hypothetical protein [Bdellovibrionales bacterium]